MLRVNCCGHHHDKTGIEPRFSRFLVQCADHYTISHLLLQVRPLFLLIQASVECGYDDSASLLGTVGPEGASSVYHFSHPLPRNAMCIYFRFLHIGSTRDLKKPKKNTFLQGPFHMAALFDQYVNM